VKDLEALYKIQGPSYKFGPLYMALANTTEEARFAALSYINAALDARVEVANVEFSSKFNQQGAHMWLLLRKLKDGVEELIPGLRPEGPPTNATMVRLLKPADLRRRKLLQSIWPLSEFVVWFCLIGCGWVGLVVWVGFVWKGGQSALFYRCSLKHD